MTNREHEITYSKTSDRNLLSSYSRDEFAFPCVYGVWFLLNLTLFKYCYLQTFWFTTAAWLALAFFVISVVAYVIAVLYVNCMRKFRMNFC